ncbi:hypothetical protein BC937DRAFT_89497 [Endogone sp. FLAS-F59071]|nr:hypothetical protein BC937DRAFT_89497 [Endogone sp. FLAS-F59071]|eukprot:RUS17784.1 hypothetical protein BC937DRAFT_89497 [Endogone sp. FLAS-F59071]
MSRPVQHQLDDHTMHALIDIRRRAQLAFKNKNLQEALSLYTESLSRFSTDPIAYNERAMVHNLLVYPELELCDT